jgi:hypothetical protein
MLQEVLMSNLKMLLLIAIIASFVYLINSNIDFFNETHIFDKENKVLIDSFYFDKKSYLYVFQYKTGVLGNSPVFIGLANSFNNANEKTAFFHSNAVNKIDYKDNYLNIYLFINDYLIEKTLTPDNLQIRCIIVQNKENLK